MPSTTRTPSSLNPTRSAASSSSVSPLKRKAMSITQTYYLAHTARGKLSSEASRADHDLRLLVGHANLLDSLMIDLAEAEQEQESWFNQSVKGAAASTKTEEPRRVQWAETVVEEPEEDWQAEDAEAESDSEDEEEDEDVQMAGQSLLALQRSPARAQQVPAPVQEDEDYEDDGEEDYAALTLTLSPSHSASPPELSDDSENDDSSEDDESMPPSPPTTALPTFSAKQREQIATTSFYEQGFFIPQREAPGAPTTISVY